jgi:hypothetical protein
MKRTTIPALLVSSLLFVSGIWGQETSSQTGNPSSKGLQWEILGTIKVLRIWQLDPPDTYPQIAVLLVTNDDYQKFVQNPDALRQFANKIKVFSKDVNKVGPWETLSNLNYADPPGFVITLVHQRTSMMVVAGVQEPPDNP